MLGTGAADGWPSPFCACTSCRDARDRRRVRQPTAALLDGRILLDAGPAVPAAVARARRSLREVHHILVTHAHHDHLDPALLLSLDWVPTAHTVHVWGPPAVVDACRPWVGPSTPVELHVARAGDTLALATPEGTWHARALPSSHDPGLHGGAHDALAAGALMYDVTGPGGARVLYATDTGPLPAAVLGELRAAAFDTVLIEETFGDRTDHRTGHLDLESLPLQVDALRACGAITPATDVVAVHLGHHNPPEPELRERLAKWGVRLVDDGTVLGRRERTLVIGGARSGKSGEAERRALGYPRVTYAAAAGPRPGDPEWAERVAAHRARRPRHWHTVEGHAAVSAAIRRAGPAEAVVVDCLTLWLTGILDDASGGDWERAGRAALRAAAEAAGKDLVDAVESSRGAVILVTNEVGQGIVPTTAAGRWFVDLQGRLNQDVGRACDDVVLMVAGRGFTAAAIHAGGSA
ncbi:MAG: bifunctional adenosylcobinamide kinase/adenosylcobinamide-phosphate guanylyltransferase [bacterium]